MRILVACGLQEWGQAQDDVVSPVVILACCQWPWQERLISFFAVLKFKIKTLAGAQVCNFK